MNNIKPSDKDMYNWVKSVSHFQDGSERPQLVMDNEYADNSNMTEDGHPSGTFIKCFRFFEYVAEDGWKADGNTGDWDAEFLNKMYFIFAKHYVLGERR